MPELRLNRSIMDWIGFQHKLRDPHQLYFVSRQMTWAKCESAKSKDTAEQARQIDAVIRGLSRERLPENFSLTEQDKDILAVRFDWAWNYAQAHILDPWPLGQEVSEDDFEFFLIDMWHKEGREKYRNLLLEHVARLEGRGLKMRSNKKQSQSENPPETPLPPAGRR